MPAPSDPRRVRSDLADEVQRGGQRLVALFPRGGADLAGVRGDVLRGLDLAQQFLGVTPDSAGVDLDELDAALGIDHEGAAVGQAVLFDHDAEVAGDRSGRVADHEVLDLVDRVGRGVPRLVREVGVGGHGVDLDTELLELRVVVGEVAQLGGAHEGEVGGVEEHDRPLAVQVGVTDVDELALVEGGRIEGQDFGSDDGHRFSDRGVNCSDSRTEPTYRSNRGSPLQQ